MGPRDPCEDTAAAALGEGCSARGRGVKRSHHIDMECSGGSDATTVYPDLYYKFICTDSCDCEEFGQPLAKRINMMNLQQKQQSTSSQSSSSQQQPSSTSSASDAATTSSTAVTASAAQFADNYPFSPSSPYYSTNLLLRKLYAERVTRNPHMKHEPT